jgi:predicted phage terminase large subunit-like protein
MPKSKSWVRDLADAYTRLLDLDTKAACEKALIELTAYCWPIIDPGEELVTGWAMDAIAGHLEAVHHGHINRLLITVPPGFSKSSLTNVFFPLWIWLQEPHTRFICASYEQGISERDNMKCMRIIRHEKWQHFWGDRFKLVTPTTIGKFENDHTGWKMATSVGGALIGHRANYILIDDPNDPKVENQSGAKRNAAVRWFRETVPTRLNNMARDKIIVIQQRLHMEDVAGTALGLEHENYVHLNIPMEYEPRLWVNAFVPSDNDDEPDQIETLYDDAAAAVDPDNVFWSDPRTQDGELAWPERFPRRIVEKMKKTLGRTMAASQLQQRPVPRGGNIVKTSDWKIWKEEKFPAFTFILATLDTAYTENERNDPSGLTIWGLTSDEHGNLRIMLIYAWTDWLELTPLVRRVLHTCTRNDILYEECEGLPRFPVDKLVIEGKASGISVQQEIARLLQNGVGRKLPVDMLPAKLLRDDKISRLISVSHLFENGMIWAPDKQYADGVIDQIGNFPYASHDEYVDCTSMALRWLRDQSFAPTRDEAFEDAQSEMMFRPKPKPLYGSLE